MEYVYTFLVWIYICLFAKCSAEYLELNCDVNLMTMQRVCDCKNSEEVNCLPCDVYFRANEWILQAFALQTLNGSANNLIIQNCNKLFVLRDTFADVGHIEHIQFKDIGQLFVETDSLAFKKRSNPKIKLTFLNVSHFRATHLIAIW